MKKMISEVVTQESVADTLSSMLVRACSFEGSVGDYAELEEILSDVREHCDDQALVDRLSNACSIAAGSPEFDPNAEEPVELDETDVRNAVQEVVAAIDDLTSFVFDLERHESFWSARTKRTVRPGGMTEMFESIKRDLFGESVAKLSLRQLKQLIREAIFDPPKSGVRLKQDDDLGSIVYMTRDELVDAISNMGPDDVSDADYVDDNSGEVVLEKGKLASSSQLHPEHVPHGAKKFSDMNNDDYFDEDVAVDYEKQYMDAVIAFADQCSEIDVMSTGEDVSAFAYDIALNFFHEHPEWSTWSQALGISRREMAANVAEYVADAMSANK
jgi:hypothetical protein